MDRITLNAKSKYFSLNLQVEPILTLAIFLISCYGLVILYSAVNQNLTMFESQIVRFIIGIIFFFLLAQVPPEKFRAWTPYFYVFALLLLIIVLFIGHIGKGAQRWINLGLLRFQPAELMKIALPLMLSWYFFHKPLPPSTKNILVAMCIIGVPAILTAKQPDLGTAILIALAGFGVLILAGLSWRLLWAFICCSIALIPFIWHFMRDYQKQRLLTFLNPESDPLGSGYHIIQSKIAIGSGGLLGKGWLHGTQSHLQFLPEHSTDFIFAVCGEEFGFIGITILMLLYAIVIMRCIYIASKAKDDFSRLLAGSIALTFFFSIFINIGMVSGLLPVVGVPLPLISYGGTSVVTTLASFGIITAIYRQRKIIG